MGKICWAALVVVMTTASTSFGGDSAYAATGQRDPHGWNAIAASGLRYSGDPISVRTGHVEGVAPFGDGCGWGGCYDWKVMPWYGSWGDGHGNCGCRGTCR